MARILILYGTGEGQTRKIAAFVADKLSATHQATLLDATDVHEPLNFSNFDAAIIAASLHAGGFQKSVARAVASDAARLAGMPNAFMAVSLSAAGDDVDDWRGLEECLERFWREADWRAEQVEHVAGAFRYTQYDYFKRMLMRQIAKKRGAPVDISRDWELTDWDQLAKFAEAFSARVAAAA